MTIIEIILPSHGAKRLDTMGLTWRHEAELVGSDSVSPFVAEGVIHVRRIRASRVTKNAVDQPIRMMPLIPSIAETNRQFSAMAASS